MLFVNADFPKPSAAQSLRLALFSGKIRDSSFHQPRAFASSIKAPSAALPNPWPRPSRAT